MARQYSLHSFLRQAPNDLLQWYLSERDLGADLRWPGLRERDIEPINAVIEAAPEPLRRTIERDFGGIYALADQGGTTTVIEEGRDSHHSVELAETLGGMKSHIQRAFWVFLEHPRVFKVASRLHYADSLARWRKRDDLPDTEPDTSREGVAALEDALSDYYRNKEGRGQACKVDHYRRGDRLYWFAYPEDYAVGRFVYDEDHQLEVQTQRPAFEVIFVHFPEERSLDTWVRGKKDTLVELQRIFGSVILGVDLGYADKTGVVYELDGLLSRDFPFHLEPEDGVDEVRVVRLRTRVGGASSGQHITFEASAKADPKAIYDLLDDVLASKRISKDRLQVTSARLRLLFRPEPGDGRRTLPIDVSHPDSCSLRYGPRDDLAKQLLKRKSPRPVGCRSPPKHRCLPEGRYLPPEQRQSGPQCG